MEVGRLQEPFRTPYGLRNLVQILEARGRSSMFALTWRCDGSEGVKWNLRGIREDGSFYGEIRFQSEVASRRKAIFVSGRLPLAEQDRLTALIGILRQAPRLDKPGRHFGALFERLSPNKAGDVRRLYEYQRGEEVHSLLAKAFVELVALFNQQLSPFNERITRPRGTVHTTETGEDER